MIIAYNRSRRPVNPLAGQPVNMLVFGFPVEGSGGATPVVASTSNAPFIANLSTMMCR